MIFPCMELFVVIFRDFHDFRGNPEGAISTLFLLVNPEGAPEVIFFLKSAL